MAILEKYVLTGISSRNLRYYESLGYEVPRRKNKEGEKVLNPGVKIKVKVIDLPKTVKIKVTRICDTCYKQDKVFYGDLINARENKSGIDECRECAMKKAGVKNKNNVEFKNSFEYKAKSEDRLDLLDEYSEKNIKKVNEISFGTSEKIIWNCLKCSSEYSMIPPNRFYGQSCPYCTGKRVNHTNCLWSTQPEVAKLLKDSRQGYKLTQRSGKKEIFLCPQCYNENRSVVAKVTERGLKCQYCSKGFSYPERLVSCVLRYLNINFIRQKTFSWSVNYSHKNNRKLNGDKNYDFYIPLLDIIIETHGKQHYEEIPFFHKFRSFEEEVENDGIKKELAVKNKVKKYIVLDCRKSDLNYIKNSMLNSELFKVFNLKEVDWLECNKEALSSSINTVCKIWNDETKDITEIAEITNLDKTTVWKYLKKGTEIGLCEYDTKYGLKIGWEKSAKANSKPILQFSKNGEFIKKWKSAKEVGQKLGLNHRSLRSAIIRNGKFFDYIWMYEEDYIERGICL